MRKEKHCMVAIDLGASSGRMIYGEYDGSQISFLDEYRMENGFIIIGNGYYWDILALYRNIIRGFRYFKSREYRIDSIGIDAWGVDYVLLDASGEAVGYPRCYRDPRALHVMDEVHAIVSPWTFYETTAILPGCINTVYQLSAERKCERRKIAKYFLHIQDYICYLLTGEMATDCTIASTSQMLDWKTGRYSEELLNRLDLTWFNTPDILVGAQPRGMLSGSFSDLSGYVNIPVMNISSHDTGSAISLAVALEDHELLMNNGTYAIVASIQDKPLISEQSFRFGITNESTLDGRFRPACNLNGMYFINQAKAWWKLEGKQYDWEMIQKMAVEARSYEIYFPLDDPNLSLGGDMPARVREYCARNGFHIPETDGEIVRLILESTAKGYADAIVSYESALEKQFNTICVEGGGSKNAFLNQLIADMTGKTVRIGPMEATAFGNMLAQLEGMHVLSTQEHLAMIKAQFQNGSFKPQS